MRIVNSFFMEEAVGLFSIKKQYFDSNFLIDKSRAEWYNIPTFTRKEQNK